MEVVRKFEFDAAHRLSKGEPTPCHNIHGHRYVVELGLDSPGLDQLDMVIDFSVVKSVIVAPLLQVLDHSIILNQDDESGIVELCRESQFKMLLLRSDPTVETLALWMQKFAEDAISKSDKLPSFKVGITVYETPNCWVTV